MRLGIACISAYSVALELLRRPTACDAIRRGSAIAIMARDVRRMRRGLVEIKNWSIALNCGEEDTLGLADTGDREFGDATRSGLTLTELEERIAGVRENLRELVGTSRRGLGAGDEDLNAARIAEQEKELAELIELRETLLRK